MRGRDNDFVECLVFSENRGVVMTGNMVDCCKPDHVNPIVSLLGYLELAGFILKKYLIFSGSLWQGQGIKGAGTLVTPWRNSVWLG